MNYVALSDVKKSLLKAFVALGPLGNLLTPQLFSHSFRTYYFILLAFPLFFIPLRKQLMKIIVLSTPFFVYCLASSLFSINNIETDFPVLRCYLLWFQFLFTLGAAVALKNSEEGIHLLVLYMKCYFISLIVGFLMYIGFYLHWISFDFLGRFSVLTQMGYGILRFSPGSYPNEYGIVSSFILSILTWMLLEYRQTVTRIFSRGFLILFYCLTFCAFLLATTRTAYIAYFFVLVLQAWKKRCLGKLILWVSAAFLGITLALQYFDINILNIFAVGFLLENYEDGSFSERLKLWSLGYQDFQNNPLLGNGFASATSLHNSYLQLLFELGVLGIGILIGVFVLSFLENKQLRLRLSKDQKNPQRQFLSMISMIGIIHVIVFASTNHNLNHHLTWFVIQLSSPLAFFQLREEGCSWTRP